ncbi:MAG: hypothetical protein WAW86_04910 [Gammaproteobacteria bacterium]
MASLQEIAGSLNIDIPERKPSTNNKKNIGQKRRAWLAEDTPAAPPPAEEKVTPKTSPPPPPVEEKPIAKPSTPEKPAVVKQAEPTWQPFVWPSSTK